METYTMKQWEIDGTLKIAVGQQVENDLVWELIDCVPPAYFKRGVFQVGEPKSTDAETLKSLFDTFTHDGEGENWIYRGECLYGQTENRERKVWN